MDVAYNQHSQHSRRNNRSSTSLNRLSLAPLTSRLPLNDAEALPDVSEQSRVFDHRTSYIEGRSAPTTPGILSRSSSRVSLRRPIHANLEKSKSTTNIMAGHHHNLKPPVHTPGGKHKRPVRDEEFILTSLTSTGRSDSDWLLRAGALISSETRESKGQAWLVSRASSTSLTGERDEDEEALERQLAKERESRKSSRRGSGAGGYGDADDEFSPMTTRRSFGPGSRPASRYGSRPGSMAQSRRASRLNLFTPVGLNDDGREDYFNVETNFVTEPDFVDVDEDEYDVEQELEDEMAVKRLTKIGTVGFGMWVERLMGWSLFDVEEDGEETDFETNDEKTDASESTAKSQVNLPSNASNNTDASTSFPPPGAEEGGWKDAAWLLSVATKVLL